MSAAVGSSSAPVDGDHSPVASVNPMRDLYIFFDTFCSHREKIYHDAYPPGYALESIHPSGEINTSTIWKCTLRPIDEDSSPELIRLVDAIKRRSGECDFYQVAIKGNSYTDAHGKISPCGVPVSYELDAIEKITPRIDHSCVIKRFCCVLKTPDGGYRLRFDGDPIGPEERFFAYVVEFCEGDDLLASVENISSSAEPPFSREELKYRIVGPVVLGLAEGLHENGVMHGDVKPENVMYCRSKPGTVAKIVDIGLAKAFDPASGEYPVVEYGGGTFGYVAPEGLLRESGPSSDTFSLGAMLSVLIFNSMLVSGRYPYGKGLEKFTSSYSDMQGRMLLCIINGDGNCVPIASLASPDSFGVFADREEQKLILNLFIGSPAIDGFPWPGILNPGRERPWGMALLEHPFLRECVEGAKPMLPKPVMCDSELLKESACEGGKEHFTS
jgi:serine/threonine protein kinase